MLSYRLSARLIACCALFLCVTATAAAARQRTDFGTLSIQVRPPDAQIFIDGERWNGPEGQGPLQVQVSPGVHRVEIRSPGRETYAAEITIRAGETLPLNVALSAGARTPAPPAARLPAPPPGGIVQAPEAENGFVIAPDFRVTNINHRTGELVGAYGGYVFGGQLLVGGGAYWQANTNSGSRLVYGGPVVEWRMLVDRTVGFNLHGLVGVGQWRTSQIFFRDGPVGPMPIDVKGMGEMSFGRRDDTFFVAEPEAQVVVRFGTFVRLQGGVGYRATSETGLSGASGSVSVQFGR